MQNNENMNYILKKLVNYNNVFNTQSQTEFSEDSDHEQSMIEYKDPTELVLNMCGLDKDVMHIPVELNNCCMSC